MRRPTLRPAWLLLPLVFLGAACDPKGDPFGGTSLREQLDAHWSLWQSSTAPDYGFDFRWHCFCIEELTTDVHVLVVEHELSGVTYVDDGTPVSEDLIENFPTIPQLFLTIEQAIDGEADMIHVEFDEEEGYPRSVFIDYDVQVADEELGFEVWNVGATGG